VTGQALHPRTSTRKDERLSLMFFFFSRSRGPLNIADIAWQSRAAQYMLGARVRKTDGGHGRWAGAETEGAARDMHRTYCLQMMRRCGARASEAARILGYGTRRAAEGRWVTGELAARPIWMPSVWRHN
jgi:hypothetical protein